jgi:hypothetical protein
MHLSEFNLPDRKTWNAALSPSNLAMAVLVGFLCVGQATDWKILGRKAKANSTVKLGAPDSTGKSSGAVAYRARHVRAVSGRAAAISGATKGPEATRTDPNSEEVADRRPATREVQKGAGQLD